MLDSQLKVRRASYVKCDIFCPLEDLIKCIFNRPIFPHHMFK